MRFDGTKMKFAREKLGISLRDLQGEMSRKGIDMSYQTLALWENGNIRNPGYANVITMAEVLGVDAQCFFASEPHQGGTVRRGVSRA